MTRIDNEFLRQHLQADYVEDWGIIRSCVISARRVLANPADFPKANFDYLEKLDLEGTCFLLRAPVQYII